jgi:CheY-like chemotaxis protein
VAGAQVSEAHGGEEALARLGVSGSATADNFELVLMDVQMPGMDGLEATTRVRAVPALANLPIVGLTAHAMSHDHAMCLAAGMNDVLVKPYAPRELFATVARWLARPAQPSTDAGPESAGLADGDAVPVAFDIGLQNCMGRDDLYRRVVQSFLKQHSEGGVQALTALANRDDKLLLHLAHSMKSTAGVVGAVQLAGLASQLQELLRSGQRAALAATTAEFAQEHARVLEGLAAFLDQAPAAPLG